jgi:hypothetical protein
MTGKLIVWVSYWDGDEWSLKILLISCLIETATGYHYYFDGQWEWKFNGLPTKLGYPNPNFTVLWDTNLFMGIPIKLIWMMIFGYQEQQLYPAV